MQINHLGGIDNSNWRVLKSTFESFYDELDTTTHRRLYNKYQYWKGDPSKYNSFCDIQRLSLCSPEIVTTSAPNIVSSVVQNMTDLQQYAPMLPPGFDLNRIGTLKNTFPLWALCIELIQSLLSSTRAILCWHRNHWTWDSFKPKRVWRFNHCSFSFGIWVFSAYLWKWFSYLCARRLSRCEFV